MYCHRTSVQHLALQFLQQVILTRFTPVIAIHIRAVLRTPCPLPFLMLRLTVVHTVQGHKLLAVRCLQRSITAGRGGRWRPSQPSAASAASPAADVATSGHIGKERCVTKVVAGPDKHNLRGLYPCLHVLQADYETVIGIETHVQLNTRTKAFCGCVSTFGAEPNSNVCPVCLGHPVRILIMHRRSLPKQVPVLLQP
jgi:hypothetical protein